MNWQKTASKNVMRCGEWCVIKWPWGTYCLWKADTLIGKFGSFEEAKVAASSRENHPENAGAVEVAA